MDGSICRINDEVKIAFSKPVCLTNCTSTYFVFNFVDEIVYHVLSVYVCMQIKSLINNRGLLLHIFVGGVQNFQKFVL